ncbi:hypothetical protein Q765_07125 [Flavobacterium rivuli WB 3.3-2 = DSM 21788]|uniref:Polysaccharide biosynthesis protein C-terminal domain-containing protein n=1 Tax=Flavobacterium rivuli WB 3.3-2 = DSM 21788 TaxID=1121895 RepID=A0A0A2MGJ1_9FLAO|nr:hypothetical protein [Flavobacterium rivuli]KGO87430.1 hypothetical protein Q765_07125 [Flavobacterium rivuli WB 3.3-2 = DSM 21788]
MSLFKLEPGYFNSVKWGSYSIAISFIRQIVIVSVFIATVGKHDYAFWLVLSAIVLMIRAINLGQLHYTSNLVNLNYHIKQDISKELLSGQGANILFMLAQILLSIVIAYPPVLSFFSNFDITYITSIHAQYSFVLLVFSRVILQYISLYLLRLFEPIGKIQVSIKYQVIGETLDFLVIVAAIYFTKSIFYTSLALFFFSILFSGYIYYYVKKNVPFAIPFLKGVNFRDSLLVIRQSATLTFSFIVEKIYEVGLNLVIVRAFATSALPQFDTNRKMSNAFYRVSNVLVTPILPSIQKEFTLKNENYILDKMTVFWRFSNAMLLLCVTAGMPFFLDIYTKWTSNKIDFNLNLICYLFMAIAYQNYSMIFIEFFKKTNLSKQMLVTNVVKVSATILSILVFGYYNNVGGMGIALLLGEVIALAYALIIIIAIFKSRHAVTVFLTNLLPVVLLSLTLLVYTFSLNYLLFLICNSFVLLYILWPLRGKIFNR